MPDRFDSLGKNTKLCRAPRIGCLHHVRQDAYHAVYWQAAGNEANGVVCQSRRYRHAWKPFTPSVTIHRLFRSNSLGKILETVTGLRRDLLSLSRCRLSVQRGRSQFSCIISDVVGPRFDELVEAIPVSGKQRPGGFLEAGQVTGHGRHEPVGGLLRKTHAIAALISASGLLNQFAKRDRGAPQVDCSAIPNASAVV